MSMESVARNFSAREIRARLMTPPGGRESSELEVISEARLRRMERENALRQREAEERKVHEARIAVIVDSIARRKEEWRQAEIVWAQKMANRGVTAPLITDVCCEYFKVGPLEILGQRRQVSICYARHIIAYLCSELTKKSYPEIGRFLGGRDHTTILHSHNKIAALVCAGDRKTIDDIAALREILGLPE